MYLHLDSAYRLSRQNTIFDAGREHMTQLFEEEQNDMGQILLGGAVIITRFGLIHSQSSAVSGNQIITSKDKHNCISYIHI
jgi:hypothetical protein